MHPAALRHTRDFAADTASGTACRREHEPLLCGRADAHRLPVRMPITGCRSPARDIRQLAAALAALVGTGGASANVPASANEWVWAAAQDLRANRRRKHRHRGRNTAARSPGARRGNQRVVRQHRRHRHAARLRRRPSSESERIVAETGRRHGQRRRSSCSSSLAGIRFTMRRSISILPALCSK